MRVQRFQSCVNASQIALFMVSFAQPALVMA